MSCDRAWTRACPARAARLRASILRRAASAKLLFEDVPAGSAGGSFAASSSAAGFLGATSCCWAHRLPRHLLKTAEHPGRLSRLRGTAAASCPALAGPARRPVSPARSRRLVTLRDMPVSSSAGFWTGGVRCILCCRILAEADSEAAAAGAGPASSSSFSSSPSDSSADGSPAPEAPAQALIAAQGGQPVLQGGHGVQARRLLDRLLGFGSKGECGRDHRSGGNCGFRRGRRLGHNVPAPGQAPLRQPPRVRPSASVRQQELPRQVQVPPEARARRPSQAPAPPRLQRRRLGLKDRFRGHGLCSYRGFRRDLGFVGHGLGLASAGTNSGSSTGSGTTDGSASDAGSS